MTVALQCWACKDHGEKRTLLLLQAVLLQPQHLAEIRADVAVMHKQGSAVAAALPARSEGCCTSAVAHTRTVPERASLRTASINSAATIMVMPR